MLSEFNKAHTKSPIEQAYATARVTTNTVNGLVNRGQQAAWKAATFVAGKVRETTKELCSDIYRLVLAAIIAGAIAIAVGIAFQPVVSILPQYGAGLFVMMFLVLCLLLIIWAVRRYKRKIL